MADLDTRASAFRRGAPDGTITRNGERLLKRKARAEFESFQAAGLKGQLPDRPSRGIACRFLLLAHVLDVTGLAETDFYGEQRDREKDSRYRDAELQLACKQQMRRGQRELDLPEAVVSRLDMRVETKRETSARGRATDWVQIARSKRRTQFAVVSEGA